METFTRIKESLPNLPDEVIRMWLVPIADSGYGWPPDAVGLGKWRYVLARRSLDYWRKTQWELQNKPFDERYVFSISSNPMIGSSVFGLVETYAMNRINEFSNLVNGQERFFSLVDYICANGTLPVPPIIRKIENGEEIVDGNHRLAALMYVRALGRNDAGRAYLAEKKCVPLHDLHPTWVSTPPSEGSYAPDPITEQQEKWARSFQPS